MAIQWKKLLSPKKEFKPENPQNTGNINQVNEQLRIKNELIGGRSSGSLSDVESDWLNERTYTLWELLNFQADYWVNLIQFTFKDSYLDHYIYNIIRYCFLYHKVGIWITEKGLIPIAEYETVLDECGRPILIKGFNAKEAFQQEQALLTEKSSGMKRYTITKEIIESKKYVRLINNSAINNYYKWVKFSRQQMEYLDRFLILGVLFGKKIICKTGDPDNVSKELREFLNTKSPIFYNLSGVNFLKNTITSEGLDELSPEPFCMAYEKFLEYYYEILGRRINSDEKGARNLTTEIETTQQNFYNLQNNWILTIKNFLEDFKKESGFNYEILNELMVDPNEKNELTNQQISEKGQDNAT